MKAAHIQVDKPSLVVSGASAHIRREETDMLEPDYYGNHQFPSFIAVISAILVAFIIAIVFTHVIELVAYT